MEATCLPETSVDFQNSAWYLLYTGFLLNLLFNPEDGIGMFL
jgi:hypothetical protein